MKRVAEEWIVPNRKMIWNRGGPFTGTQHDGGVPITWETPAAAGFAD